jgi:acetyl-CoA carboxylase carboxyl transferase subunit beta
MGWFSKNRPDQDASEKRTLGAGLFRRCDACGVTLLAEDFTSNLEVCPQCSHHYPLSGEAWMELLTDPGSFEEHDTNLSPKDFLGFTDS